MEHVNPYGTYEFPVESEYARTGYRSLCEAAPTGPCPSRGEALGDQDHPDSDHGDAGGAADGAGRGGAGVQDDAGEEAEGEVEHGAGEDEDQAEDPDLAGDRPRAGAVGEL